MKVADIMIYPVITAKRHTRLSKVAALMLEHQIGCVPIVGYKGELLGMITETDFMPRLRNLPFSDFRMPHLLGRCIPMEGHEKVYKEVGSLKAEDMMTPSVFTAKEDDSIDDVIAQMLERRMNHVPVLRENLLIGILTRHDILRAFLRQSRRVKSKVSQIAASKRPGKFARV